MDMCADFSTFVTHDYGHWAILKRTF